MKLTDQQMLALWRRSRRLEPARSDCSIEVFDGYETEAALTLEMRQWYLDLLDNADLKYLELSDIATQLKFSPTASGAWQAELPLSTRRIIALQISGCAHRTIVSSVVEAERQITLNTNPYSRSGLTRPVAYVVGRTLSLFCKTDDGVCPTITAASAVVDPGDELYIFNDSALTLLPKPL
jgi:hypothetical protein